MDKWAIYKKCDDFRVAAPKYVNDIIEIKSIADNGIFEVGRGGVFSKTYMFDDINYSKASIDEQISILESWCGWLNSNSAPFKITMNNKNKNMQTVSDQVLFGKTKDGFDTLRKHFNDEIEYTIQNGRQGIEQQLYLTIRYDTTGSYDDAKLYFDSLESSMRDNFRAIGSEIRPLDASERLRIIHDMYRFGDEEDFNFNFKNAVNQGFDFLDAVSNNKCDFSHDEYFKCENKYMSAIYLHNMPFGSKLSDRFLTRIASQNIKMMISLDCSPITDADTNAFLKSKYLSVEDRIRKQNKTRVKDLDFSSDISLAVKQDRDTITEDIKDVRENNQKYFYTMLNIIVIADDLETLQMNVKQIDQIAKDNSCKFEYSYQRQREALNTVLPLGIRQVQNGHNLKTRAVAALFPFNTQELFMPDGEWYGKNQVSNSIVTVNRKKLMNANGFIFGESGSGKTVSSSLSVFEAFLKYPDDDIIVVDPKNDYTNVCKKLGGSYMNINTSSPNRFNPLEFWADGSKTFDQIADEKSDLVMALVEKTKKDELNGNEVSLVDHALKTAYQKASLSKETINMAVENDFDYEPKKYFSTPYMDEERKLEYFVGPDGCKMYLSGDKSCYGIFDDLGNFKMSKWQKNGYYNNDGVFVYCDGNSKGYINGSVTLKSLYDAFGESDHPLARDLRLSLTPYITDENGNRGSLNIFGEKSNVNMSANRLIMFGLKDLGQNLRDVSMIIMLEFIRERIMRNYAMGKSTWLFIDECHELLHTAYTQDYLKKLWVLVRSLGGICTGITQNVSDVCKNDTTRAMVENSEFLIVLKQKTSTAETLRDVLGLSDEMIKSVTQERLPGKGIIRAGTVTVPFDWTIRKDNPLYDITNTNFYELNKM